MRGARCVHRCVSVIFDLFVLAYVSAGAPQTSTCPATLAPATTGTPLKARPAAAAPTKLGEGSWYGEGRFSCLHLGVVLASRRRGPLPRPNSRTHRHTHATQKRAFPMSNGLFGRRHEGWLLLCKSSLRAPPVPRCNVVARTLRCALELPSSPALGCGSLRGLVCVCVCDVRVCVLCGLVPSCVCVSCLCLACALAGCVCLAFLVLVRCFSCHLTWF